MRISALWTNRRVRRVAIAVVVFDVLLVLGVLALTMSTAVTRESVDTVIRAKPIPRYVKAIDFVHRHEHYGLLAAEITRGLSGDRARAGAILEWMRATIKDPPPGFPSVDDHVWDTIVRRYGSGDQQADVLTVLLTYAGIPAYREREPGGTTWGYACARINGEWLVVHIEHGGFERPSPGMVIDPPDPLFAELQMPGPRFVFELRQLIGW
jgi:transglutaminase-like putative cysteine protease